MFANSGSQDRCVRNQCYPHTSIINSLHIWKCYSWCYKCFFFDAITSLVGCNKFSFSGYDDDLSYLFLRCVSLSVKMKAVIHHKHSAEVWNVCGFAVTVCWRRIIDGFPEAEGLGSVWLQRSALTRVTLASNALVTEAEDWKHSVKALALAFLHILFFI